MSRRNETGFTLTEVLIAAVLLILMAGVIAGSMRSLTSLTVQGGTQTQLQQLGEQAMLRILEDLKSSGFVEDGGLVYPYFFDDGNALAPFDVHAHPAAVHEADPGDPDHGANREIVFLKPEDADLDRVPDVDVDGMLQWSVHEVSYVVVTRENGVNYLERRVDGQSPEIIAHHVERVTFEDSHAVSYQIPLNAVRIRIWFRQRDRSEQRLYRHHVEATVWLRNGGILGDPQ